VKSAIAIAATCALALPTAGRAAEPFVILGPGTETCAQFTADPGGQPQFTQWALGFISGINSTASGLERNAGKALQSPVDANAWLKKYCASRPHELLATAALALRTAFLDRPGERKAVTPAGR
jgi:hypothetical protein